MGSDLSVDQIDLCDRDEGTLIDLCVRDDGTLIGFCGHEKGI